MHRSPVATSGAPTPAGVRPGTHSNTRPFIDVPLLMKDDSFRALNTEAALNLSTGGIPICPKCRRDCNAAKGPLQVWVGA